jgi:hypothetical protein
MAAPPSSLDALIFDGLAPLCLLSWPRGWTHGVEVCLSRLGLDSLSSRP